VASHGFPCLASFRPIVALKNASATDPDRLRTKIEIIAQYCQSVFPGIEVDESLTDKKMPMNDQLHDRRLKRGQELGRI
jgi:hypothetical protein